MAIFMIGLPDTRWINVAFGAELLLGEVSGGQLTSARTGWVSQRLRRYTELQS